MCGLLPRSLPSPIPHNPYQSSGSSWSLASGDLRRLSPGRLCCSSKEISGQIWFCCGKFAGDCVPLGSGAGDPIGTGVSSTASPGGLAPPPPPPLDCVSDCPSCLLAAAASIKSTNMALPCIAPCPARSTAKRLPISRLSNRTVWAHLRSGLAYGSAALPVVVLALRYARSRFR